MVHRNEKSPTHGDAEADSNQSDDGMRATRLGARLPENWISTPEYLGVNRRVAHRRKGKERREFSRVGDGRLPRRAFAGRRESEKHGYQYRDLMAKD